MIYITNNATGGTFARLEMADAIERPLALRIVRQMHMSLPKLVCENIEFVNVRSLLSAQPVDATQALNLSAGVSNVKVLRGRSLS